MKSVIFNGTEENDDALNRAHDMIAGELAQLGWQVNSLLLHKMQISSCSGCFGCWVETPGLCVIDDDGRDIAEAYVQSDLAVFLTRVTFGGYSVELKKAIERLVCLISPFFTRINGVLRKRPRYEKYPRLVAVGYTARPDEESKRIFASLVSRNALSLHAPSHIATVIPASTSDEEIRKCCCNMFTVVGAN